MENFQVEADAGVKVGNVVTAANFNAALSATMRSVKSMRARVQNLIVFAARFYAGEGNGNTIYLSKIVGAARVTAGLNTRGIQAYIQEVCNVVYTKDKAGNLVFKKHGGVAAEDGTISAQCNENILSLPWYEWITKNMGSNNARADWEMSKYVATVLQTLSRNEADPQAFVKLLEKAAKAAA